MGDSQDKVFYNENNKQYYEMYYYYANNFETYKDKTYEVYKGKLRHSSFPDDEVIIEKYLYRKDYYFYKVTIGETSRDIWISDVIDLLTENYIAIPGSMKYEETKIKNAAKENRKERTEHMKWLREEKAKEKEEAKKEEEAKKKEAVKGG